MSLQQTYVTRLLKQDNKMSYSRVIVFGRRVDEETNEEEPAGNKTWYKTF